jgi:hypothetical protein
MGNRFYNVWTDEAIKDLMQMATEKQNTRVIAATLSERYGFRCTRNMVIGKARREKIGLLSNRLGSLGRPKPNGKRRGAKDDADKVVRFRKLPTFIDCTPPVPPLFIPFMELNNTHCKSVEGTGADGLATYCGHPRAEGSSFCPSHHAIYWTPPQPRKLGPVFVFGGKAA